MFALVRAFILAMFGKLTGEFVTAVLVANALGDHRKGMTNEA